MMTAFASTESVIEALHLGAYDYLRKPFHPEDLLATLNRIFERLGLESDKARAEQALRDSERRFRWNRKRHRTGKGTEGEQFRCHLRDDDRLCFHRKRHRSITPGRL